MADGDISDGPRRLLTIRDDLQLPARLRPLLADFQPFIQQRNMPGQSLSRLLTGCCRIKNWCVLPMNGRFSLCLSGRWDGWFVDVSCS